VPGGLSATESGTLEIGTVGKDNKSLARIRLMSESACILALASAAPGNCH
jgi:hypothetical protein